MDTVWDWMIKAVTRGSVHGSRWTNEVHLRVSLASIALAKDSHGPWSKVVSAPTVLYVCVRQAESLSVWSSLLLKPALWLAMLYVAQCLESLPSWPWCIKVVENKGLIRVARRREVEG